MEIIEKKIENFLLKHKLIQPIQPIVVGFSGGEDSTCLLYTLYILAKKHCFKLVAIHLNHNWRKEESFLEQKRCEDFAKKLNIDFYTQTLPNDLKCSEVVAREARYKFFEDATKKFNTKILITAHSKTDNVETVLYRLIKGTGLYGLQGIPEVREEKNYSIYRPMLSISRTEVIEFNKENKLVPNQDSSNLNTKYARNNIRNEIMPKLQKISPHVEKSLSSLIEVVKDEYSIIDEYLNKIKKEITTNNKFITKAFLTQSLPIQKKLIYELVKNNKITYDKKDVEEIYDFLIKNATSQEEKKISVTKDCWISVSKKFIYLLKKSDKEFEFKSIQIFKENVYKLENKTLKIEKISNNFENINKNSIKNSEIFVDLSQIEFPLTFRTRNKNPHTADFIQPFGMNGHTKLKKYLSSKHLSTDEKQNIFMLCKDNEILWIPFVGISEKIKVKTTPTHKITFKKDE